MGNSSNRLQLGQKYGCSKAHRGGCQGLEGRHGQRRALHDGLEQRVVVDGGLGLTANLGHHLQVGKWLGLLMESGWSDTRLNDRHSLAQAQAGSQLVQKGPSTAAQKCVQSSAAPTASV